MADNTHHPAPWWRVVKVGKSKQGRPLWLVRIGKAVPHPPRPVIAQQAGNHTDHTSPSKKPPRQTSHRPVILFYAREHADEHDSSWVAQGVIDFLLSNNPNARAIRSRFTVLIIPMLDPDGAARNVYKTDIIRGFVDDPDRPVECLAWGTWLRDWVGTYPPRNRLDVVVDLHNVESAEGVQLFPYMYEPKKGSMRARMSQVLHKSVIAHLSGYHVKRACHRYGSFRFRFGGWLRGTFGSHLMFYEVNSQAPGRHLSLYEVKALGVGILEGVATFIYSPKSAPLRRTLQRDRTARAARWERYGPLERIFPGGRIPFAQEHACKDMPTVEKYVLEHPSDGGWTWIEPLFKRYGRNGPPPRVNRFDSY